MPRGGPRPRVKRPAGMDGLFDVPLDLLVYERNARAAGAVRIAGVDEVGRGPLAGPVVAAAVVLPEGLIIPGVTDSKQIAEEERERLFGVIVIEAVAYGIGIVDERTIDEINIREASILAMERALAAIIPPPDHLLIDGNCGLSRVNCSQQAVVKGDLRSHSIAAASIIAKVTRDRLMVELHDRFPRYNFRRHKGYGTKEHLDMLRLHGPCEAHRRSFQPVADAERAAAR